MSCGFSQLYGDSSLLHLLHPCFKLCKLDGIDPPFPGTFWNYRMDLPIGSFGPRCIPSMTFQYGGWALSSQNVLPGSGISFLCQRLSIVLLSLHLPRLFPV